MNAQTDAVEGSAPVGPSDLLGTALEYAVHGWPVFPAHTPHEGRCSCRHAGCDSIGKHPRLMHGLTDASTDPTTIGRWWDMWPDANIGVRTDLLAILDVDGRGAEDSLTEIALRSDGGDLTWQDTPIVATGRPGGSHFYFRRTEGTPRSGAARIAPGLDVKAGPGAYVIAPPSLHASGERYEFIAEGRMLQPWPAWLRQPETGLLSATENPRTYRGRATAPGDRYVVAAIEGELAAVLTAPVGTRNDRLNAAAFSLFRLDTDTDADAVATALLDAALRVGLTDHEARATIRSAREARGR